MQNLLQDPVLRNIIETTQLNEPAYNWKNDVYLSLMQSIVSQQISVKAAESIFKRFLLLFPDTTTEVTPNYPYPELLLSKSQEELRSAGLSFQKIKYLQSVATFSLNNNMAFEYVNTMSDEEITQYLLPIKGVGRWTVEMLLIFVMHRPDVFPVDDLVVRQKIIKAYQLTTTGKELRRELIELAEKWRPNRTLASRYFWAWS